MIIKPSAFIEIDSYQYKNTYLKLCPSKKGKKQEDVIFKTMGDLFVYSCVLGFLIDKTIEIDKTESVIRWQVITPESQARLIALAVSKKGNIDCLKEPDKLKLELEIRSNGGMHIINDKIVNEDIDYNSFEGLMAELLSRIK